MEMRIRRGAKAIEVDILDAGGGVQETVRITPPRPKPRTDEYGRVMINGVWRWPEIEVNGKLVPHPDMDLAERNPPMTDDEVRAEVEKRGNVQRD